MIWQFSGEAWFNVFLEQDIFDDTIGFADAHLSIFLRSLRLALMATFMAVLVGFPTAYFIATRPERIAQPLALPGDHSLLDQPADPHLRDHGDHPQRGRGQRGADRARRDRRADPDALHRLRHRHGAALRLPAAHGAAALCLHREARFPPGRGRLRPLRQPLAGAAPGHPAPGQAGHDRRLDPGLHPGAGRLCHAAGAGRRQEPDAGQPDRVPVRPGPQLAARRRPVPDPAGPGHDRPLRLCAPDHGQGPKAHG